MWTRRVLNNSCVNTTIELIFWFPFFVQSLTSRKLCNPLSVLPWQEEEMEALVPQVPAVQMDE